MKTFADLVFEPHVIARQNGEKGAEIAQLDFPNGKTISVIRGSKRFHAGQNTYEVATQQRYLDRLKIYGYQTSAEITDLMKELQG